NALERAIDINPELKDYSIKAITSGTDALGEVRVRLQLSDKTVLGIGVSTDVIEASLLAYMNALNKLN
ncbi:MAG: alpha-isopropylmalate synthase regulatory domain-containing protein, partial [Cetobacterium sp.]|uniref:alpha-isopropylmalate synthase regulatory domain-containing protein n=1 Tax=Cetobacterium sp. TaxID=2071632 RepID=UPI002FC7A366